MQPGQRIIAALSTVLLVGVTVAVAARGLTAQETPAVAQETPDVAAQDSVTIDQGWPREFSSPDGHKVLVFQPQVESWDEYSRLNMRLAVALMPAGTEEPIFGALRATAETETDLEERTVVVFGHELHEATFPDVGADSTEILLEIARTAVPDASRTIALDRVLAYLEQPLLGRSAEGLSVAPPAIFVSNGPARLVLFDGEPIMSPIDGTDLLYAVNTNWDLFLQSGESRYVLRDGSVWYAAEDYTGPYERALELPQDLQKLPNDENWADVKASFPPTWIADDQVPEFFVSTTPAELIAVDGTPELTPIAGTQLLFTTNTEQDLFFHSEEGRYYYLVSGRWFGTTDLAGEWSAVEELPTDFASIPEDHPRSHVLASVPGTMQAAEAMLLAQVPQKATVDRNSVEVEVVYAGEPEFREIEGTSMSYAVNTDSDIIRVGDAYFLCHQGVWLLSSSPAGPWTAAESVPDDIYTIPASSPVYHTTYVYVYDSTPSTITYGYTAGYMGMYVWAGAVVWGTGHYYNPWYWYGPYPYPHYYSYPYTYGAATWYNPTTGFYGRGAAVYGPYGGYGASARYNPRTGTYARGAGVYGPYGGTRVGEAYNPRTGAYAATRQSRSPYAQWGGTVVTRGDDWAMGRHYSDSRGTVGTVRRSDGAGGIGVITDDRSGFVGRGADGDIYAGRDGNLYRRGEDGWQRYGDRDWQSVDQSQLEDARSRAGDRTGDREVSPQARERLGQVQGADRQRPSAAGERGDVYNRLERDRSARVNGNRRTNNWNSSRGSLGSRGGAGRARGRRRP